MSEASKIFGFNMCMWARNELKQEIDGNYPLLRQFDCWTAKWFLKFASGMDKDRQNALADVLLKHRSPYSSCEPDTPRNPQEDELLKLYFENGNLAFTSGEVGRMITPPQGQIMPRNELRNSVIGIFSEKIGRRVKVDYAAPGHLCFETRQPYCIIRTFVDIHSPHSEMNYYHEVWSLDGTRIAPFISFFQWLGISSMTIWDYVMVDGAERALTAMLQVSLKFVEAAPSLLIDRRKV